MVWLGCRMWVVRTVMWLWLDLDYGGGGCFVGKFGIVVG